MRWPIAVLVLSIGLFLIGGCGATKEREEPPPPGERQSLDRTARVAFEQGRYAQAATFLQLPGLLLARGKRIN